MGFRIWGLKSIRGYVREYCRVRGIRIGTSVVPLFSLSLSLLILGPAY